MPTKSESQADAEISLRVMFDASTIRTVIVAGLLSVPAGWAGSVIVERESGAGRHLSLGLMIASVAVAIWAAIVMPATWLLGATLLLGWILCILSAVDLLVLRLPDIITLPLVAVGLLVSVWLPDHDPLGHAAGAATGFALFYVIALVYRLLRSHEGLGLGDAKLAAAAGAWLGWQSLPSVMLIACAAAFAWVGLSVVNRGRAAAAGHIAFGVPLCIAFWLVWLYGPPL
ncbi:MAG: prepilin peptidase [Alphaproteobacteria bacterium]